MPNTLDITVDGRSLRFGDDLKVQELDAQGQPARETTWGGVTNETGNDITFRFDGETGTTLAVNYGFNGRNQLTLKIPAQHGVPAASVAWALPGKITIDNNKALVYALIDPNGDPSGGRIEVHADLHFDQGTDRLSVKFADGSEAFIQGADDHSSLVPDKYDHGGSLARDLIWFNAVTENSVNGASFPIPAEVQFVGRWDVYQDQLVFVTHYDNSGATPTAYVAIAGKFKGTNVGLILEQNGKVVFQIEGRYSWNEGDLAWQLDLGYSPGNSLQGRIAVDAKLKGKKGVFTIKGGASFSKGSHALDITFDLTLNYTAKWGSLDFSVTGGPNSYQVYFGGQVTTANFKTTFGIKFASTQGNQTLTVNVEFGSYKNDIQLKLSLQAVLSRGGLTLAATMVVRVAWGPDGLLSPV